MTFNEMSQKPDHTFKDRVINPAVDGMLKLGRMSLAVIIGVVSGDFITDKLDAVDAADEQSRAAVTISSESQAAQITYQTTISQSFAKLQGEVDLWKAKHEAIREELAQLMAAQKDSSASEMRTSLEKIKKAEDMEIYRAKQQKELERSK